MRFPAVAGAVMVVAASNVAGQAAKPAKTHSFTADLGFVNAAGNTSVTTFNVGDKLVLNSPDKKVIFTQLFSVVRSEADGVKNAENYRGLVRLDYGLDHVFYLFGLTGWERNAPAGLLRRFEETIGLAYKAVTQPNDELALELGLSMFQERTVDGAAGVQLVNDYNAGRLAGIYKHKFNPSSFFQQQLEVIPNLDVARAYRVNSETSFVAPLSTHLAIKLGYQVRFDNLPPIKPDPNPLGERLKKTDRYLTAGLTISY